MNDYLFICFSFFLFQRLSNAYDSLAKAYKKVVEVMATGKRLLGKYFRVAFFGQVTGPLKFFLQDSISLKLCIYATEILICFRYRHVDNFLFVDHSVHDLFFFLNLYFLPVYFSDVR